LEPQADWLYATIPILVRVEKLRVVIYHRLGVGVRDGILDTHMRGAVFEEVEEVSRENRCLLPSLPAEGGANAIHTRVVRVQMADASVREEGARGVSDHQIPSAMEKISHISFEVPLGMAFRV